MGVLTDLIVADKKDAQKICQMDMRERMAKFHSEEVRGVFANHLEALSCILHERPLKKAKTYKAEREYNAYLSKTYPLLFQESDEGSWIHQLPDDLIVALARVERKDLKRVAKAWIDSGEFMFWANAKGRLDTKLAVSALERIQPLFIEAVDKKLSILMWICL